YSHLETRRALGAWNHARAQPRFASVVLRLDLAAGGLAACLRLERSLDHAFLILLVLGRTAFCVAVARGPLDALLHHCPGLSRAGHAGPAKEDDCGSDLIALSKSAGSGASKLFHSPVRGCRKPSFQACSICRGKPFAYFAP